jgi:hypothetical protein
MSARVVDEARVEAYLLGLSSPDEQAAIEERYLADPDFLAEVQSVERDLIDRYLRGEITDRAAFESHFMASSSRRERVEFARALMHADRHSAARRWVGAWPAAAAAALVIAVAGWLVLDGTRPESEPPVAQAPTPAPAAPSSGPVPPAPVPDTAPPAASRPVMALTLLPTSTRSGGPPPILTVRPDIDVRLELVLEVAADRRFGVRVRAVGGDEVARRDGLTAVRLPAGPAVVVLLPGAALAPDDYVVTLSSVTGTGTVEEIGGYYFRTRAP